MAYNVGCAPNVFAKASIHSLTYIQAKLRQGAAAGEWGSDVRVDASIADTAVLVTKLNGLKVPPLPPNLELMYGRNDLATASGGEATSDSGVAVEWRPKVDTLIASSSFLGGHTGPVSRLSVAPDERYFVSSSYDGTVRVWESRQIEDSDGVLTSSASYAGHSEGCEQRHPRINDVATLANTHSVVSGASDGSVHVWRVDMTSSHTALREFGNRPSEKRYVVTRCRRCDVFARV